jgi:hypothetical protein
MRFRLLIVLAVIGAVIATSASVATSALTTSKTKICGQIKHGPRAAYTSLATHVKLSGTSWTVFATGVPCAQALKSAPVILKWFPTVKVGASNFQTGGFACNKEDDGHGKSGSVGCSYKGLSNIELIMTGPYSIAQLKQRFGIQ